MATSHAVVPLLLHQAESCLAPFAIWPFLLRYVLGIEILYQMRKVVIILDYSLAHVQLKLIFIFFRFFSFWKLLRFLPQSWGELLLLHHRWEAWVQAILLLLFIDFLSSIRSKLIIFRQCIILIPSRFSLFEIRRSFRSHELIQVLAWLASREEWHLCIIFDLLIIIFS